MKLIQYNEENKVIGIIELRNDATVDNTVLVETIPEYIAKEGFSGILKYSPEQGLYWEYKERAVRNNGG